MFQYELHQKIKTLCLTHLLDIAGPDHAFYLRMITNANTLQELYYSIYVNTVNTSNTTSSIPTCLATAIAVFLWSPVSITVFNPS